MDLPAASAPTTAVFAGGAVGEHVLHVFPSFGVGGVPLRTVRIMNHFGGRLRHTVVALDRNFEAARHLADTVPVSFLPGEPGRGVTRTLFNCLAVLRRLRPDLLTTYNWGAIEWAMANRLAAVSRQIHFEDGFGRDEADRQIRRRVIFRRWALARCTKVVVPSRTLESLAQFVWKLPAGRVAYVPNGVDTERFTDAPPDLPHGFAEHPGQLVIGTVAPLRPEKNIGRLLRAFASLENCLDARLVIAGEGIERQPLARLAAELGVGDRVVFTGHVAPESVLGGFDVFALSSDTEQMPITLLEAMAAGRAIAAVDVGDVKAIVCEENRDFIVSRDDGAAFAASIARLLRDPERRAELGRRNRERAVSTYPLQRMFSAYSRLFGLNDQR